MTNTSVTSQMSKISVSIYAHLMFPVKLTKTPISIIWLMWDVRGKFLSQTAVLLRTLMLGLTAPLTDDMMQVFIKTESKNCRHGKGIYHSSKKYNEHHRQMLKLHELSIHCRLVIPHGYHSSLSSFVQVMDVKNSITCPKQMWMISNMSDFTHKVFNSK